MKNLNLKQKYLHIFRNSQTKKDSSECFSSLYLLIFLLQPLGQAGCRWVGLRLRPTHLFLFCQVQVCVKEILLSSMTWAWQYFAGCQAQIHDSYAFAVKHNQMKWPIFSSNSYLGVFFSRWDSVWRHLPSYPFLFTYGLEV